MIKYNVVYIFTIAFQWTSNVIYATCDIVKWNTLTKTKLQTSHSIVFKENEYRHNATRLDIGRIDFIGHLRSIK